MVLKEAWGLPDPTLSDAAMALNGGIAYRGGPCGAITGAALALGVLAGSRFDDHREAKTAARRLTAAAASDFEQEFGSIACRDLIGMNISTDDGHHAFIASGIWRDRCMRQVEHAVRLLAPLADPDVFAAAVADPSALTAARDTLDEDPT